MRRLTISFAIALFMASSCFAAQWGMKSGNPGLKSAGSLVFGKEGVLFVGDAKSASVFAIDTGDKEGNPNDSDINVSGIDHAVAKLLNAKTATINDLAVNPETGSVFLSVSHGEAHKPAIVQVQSNGQLKRIPLKKINYSKVELPNAPEPGVKGRRGRGELRDDSITDLAYSEGKVLVSGVRDDRKATVRELVFPFLEADKGVNIEIYHGAHGKFEDGTNVKTFIPFNIDGEPHLLAGFQCTPLVKFPISELKGAEKVRGTTVAELGNRNRPLDMIVYNQNGQDFLLITNTARGVMKVSTEDIERSEGIEERISGIAGQKYETIESLKDVEQLDRLNQGHAVIIAKNGDAYDLATIDLP